MLPGSQRSVIIVEERVNIYRIILIGLVLLTSGLCRAQEAARDTTGDAAFYDAVHQVTFILEGAPLEQVERYVCKEGMAIINDSTMVLRALLKSSNRQSLFHEDSTRHAVSIQARTDTTDDAAYVVIKTVDAEKGNPHYHSFTLFKEPDQGWQVFLWHVGG